MTKYALSTYVKSIMTDTELQVAIADLFTNSKVIYSDNDLYDQLKQNLPQDSPYQSVPLELFKEILKRVEGRTINGIVISRYDVNKLIAEIDNEEKANAGPNQTIPSGTLTATMNGNLPDTSAIGKWVILTGSNGSFDDDTLPNAVLTGQAGETYTLAWLLLQASPTMSVITVTFES